MSGIPYNLLGLALGQLPVVSIAYEKFTGNTANSYRDVPAYAAAITIDNAHAQPLSNKMYKELGLDFQKTYYNVYIPADVVALDKQNSPDRLTFYGKTWYVVTSQEWFNMNGWNKLTVIAEKDYER